MSWILGLWILMPLLIVPGFVDPFITPKEVLFRFAGSIALARLCLLDLAMEKEPLQRRSVEVGPSHFWLILALVQFLTISWDQNVGRGLEATTDSLAVFALAEVVRVTRLDLRVLARAIWLPIGVLAALLLLATFFRYAPIEGYDLLGATLGHRNKVAIYLVVVLPLGLMALNPTSARGRLGGALLLIVTGYVLSVVRSRTAMGLFLVGALLNLWWVMRTETRKHWRYQLGAFAACATGALAAGLLPGRLRLNTSESLVESFFSAFSDEGSHGRFGIWRAAAVVVQEKIWTGWGSGQTLALFREAMVVSGLNVLEFDSTWVSTLFNDLLQFLFESGFGGGTSFLLGTFGVVYLAMRNKSSKADSPVSAPGLVILSFGLIVIDSLVDYPFRRPETLLVFATLLGVVSKSLTWRLHWPSPKYYKQVLVTAGFLMATLMVGISVLKMASLLIRSEDPDRVRVSMKLWPYDYLWQPAHLLALQKAGYNVEAREFVENQRRYWPSLRKTSLAEAISIFIEGRSAESLEAFRKVFAFSQVDCPRGPYKIYEDLFREQIGAGLGAEELGPCAPHVTDLVEWERFGPELGTLDDNPVVLMRGQDDLDQENLRPFVWRVGQKKLEPLLTPEFRKRLSGWDFEKIVKMGSAGPPDQILFVAAKLAPEKEVKLINVSGGRIHEESARRLLGAPEIHAICGGLEPGILAVQAAADVSVVKTTEKGFAILANAAMPLASKWDTCGWLNKDSILGIRQKPGGGVAAWLCRFRGLNFRIADCARINEPFDQFEEARNISAAAEGGLYFQGRKLNDERFSLFRVAAGGDGPNLSPISVAASRADADLIESDQGGVLRLTAKGRYFLDHGQLLKGDGVVYSTIRSGQDIYAVYSDIHTPRTLTKLDGDHWRDLTPSARRPLYKELERITLNIGGGDEVEALVFGRRGLSRWIVWWHGGREAISPRYYPVFEVLNRLGFGVLAPNFAGTTGYGKQWERRAEDSELQRKTIRSALQMIRRMGGHEVVSWSVSSGSYMQDLLIDELQKHRGTRVRAVIDQVGGANEARAERCSALGVAYLAIRGRHDSLRSPGERADIEYEGDHFLKTPRQFREVMGPVTRFLRGF